MKEDKVTLELDGYMVAGDAIVQLWGGGKGTIAMKPTYITRENWCRRTLLESINDGGFGCEEILSAKVWIYKCYGVHSPHKVLSKCFEIEGAHLKPAKIGI